MHPSVTRLFKFTRISLRDLFATAAPTVLAIAAACVLAYMAVDPTPPRAVTLGTGQENSAYEKIGERYVQAMRKHGISVRRLASQGSQQNLQRLKRGEVDIAFVQSGSTDQDEAERLGLVSLGSLFTEPVWLFLRQDKAAAHVTQLRGLRINLGPEGSGVPRLFRQVLDVNGVDAAELHTGALENTPATVELLEGRIDGLVFAAAPDDPLIQMLLMTPGIVLFDFTQAEAYTRRLPFLTHVTLPRGIVDLGRDLPARDYALIAPTATLVARADLHPALVDLFVQAASVIHGGPGWFQQQGQFPSPRYTEIPVAREAAKFYKDGPPFLQRYMSFWLANLFDRMWVVLLALGALVLPLSRVLPPLYVWRVRSRVYRWYGQLRVVEQQLEEGRPREELLRRLDQIETRVNQLSVPLSFADEVYGLRSHIQMVRQRIKA